MLAEKCFSQIDIYEQRSALAGVWNYTPENDGRGAFAIPQTDPRQPLDKPIWRHAPGHGYASKQATFVSPLYDRLEANLPKGLMQHSDTPFPDEEQLFPTHASITLYLEKYAEEVKHLVKFEHQVMSIRKNKTWQLSALDLVSKTPSTEDYDAVVVASGHYNIPFIPDRPGLQEWAKQYPGVVTHAKLYRRPEDYRGKVCHPFYLYPITLKSADTVTESPHRRHWPVWLRHCISNRPVLRLPTSGLDSLWPFQHAR